MVLLQLIDIDRESVFACYLVALGEVVDLLMLIQAFVQVRFAGPSVP